MSGTAASVLGVLVLLAGAVAMEVLARGRGRTAPAADAVAAAMRTTAGRVLVLATWVWLGVHFLAR